jgi:3-dehydroquinate synthase class II
MESTNKRKKWITLLLTATMSVALLFGATACNDKNDGNTDIIIEDNSPDIIVPEGDGDADLDVDIDVDSEAPASPSAS